METESVAPLAILIDADNTPHGAIGQILDHCHKYGNTIIRRAYGDWSTPQLKEWSTIFKEYAIKPIQQFQYTTGKNSTDIAMVIDAMDILHSKGVETFILVTSDSDFTGLSVRIREEGLRVIGIGRRTAPQTFVKGCQEFVFIENLVPSHLAESTSVFSKDPKIIPDETDPEGIELLTKAVQILADENGLILGADLGLMLRKLDPAFSPVNYGSKNLTEFIRKHPSILVDTKQKSGQDKKYKITLA